MRYKDLSGKELIHADLGKRLGVLGQTDIEINEQTGKIEKVIIQDYTLLGSKKGTKEQSIPWHEIDVIGEDMIIIRKEE
ncbi:YlmC/YmxH family sporulation protein [Halalkalibacillus halophilus]|uniref:YlmC/YmxH family sporulation protein n=1 Tax=Halalkalibacillus halophilus TaxID=392827 RepID=UPI00040AA43B|nr:YlmC/YmxH family sporulation protein [Halalkalibacillus halophilus]